MTTIPYDQTQLILMLLEQNLEGYAKLLELTRSHQDNPASDLDIDLDNSVLEKRLRLMEEIDRRNAELGGLQAEWTSNQSHPGIVFKIERVQEEIRSIITEILQLDKNHLQSLDMAKNATKLELQRSQSYAKLSRTYQPDRELGAWFIDKAK